MRLAFKFALAFFVVTVLVWGVASYFRVQREIALFEQDIRRDHTAVGLDLAAAVADIWSFGGREAAQGFVRDANESKSRMLIRMVSSDSVLIPDQLNVPTQTAEFESETSSVAVNHIIVDSAGHGWLRTYVDVPLKAETSMMIELTESLGEKDRYIKSTVQRTVLFTVILGVLAGSLAMLLGVVFIARPVSTLVQSAQRIAGGDFTKGPNLKQRDELGVLGTELGIMCDSLAEARHQVATESAARQTTLEQLRHADRLTTVGRLASSVAHELGTPLNVIKARARMIAEGEVVGEEAIASSRDIVNQSSRMAQTLRDLLDYSRRHAPRKERVDLRLVINQTVEMIHPLARKSQIDVKVDEMPEPFHATVDPDQIRQVLLNLMVNGIEAMPDGGNLNVYAGFESSGSARDGQSPAASSLKIRICDSGAGISPEDIPRLFEPFFTTKGHHAGTGLGLSIAAEIMRDHGGRVEVTSEPGGGSEFAVHIPVDETVEKETC